ALLVGFFLFVVPPLAVETQKAVTNLPHLLKLTASLINRVAPGQGQRIVKSVQPAVLQMAAGFAAPSAGVLSALAAAVQVAFLSIYWLISRPGLKRFVLTLVPASAQQAVGSVFDDMSSTMGGYVRGTILDAIIVGIILYIGLLIIGVQYPLLLAMIGAVGELIPLIGPTVAEGVAAAMALLISPERALIVLAFYMILEQVDGNVILPLVVRQQANIPPLLITFAVFTGAWVDGIVGALVAIPLAGVVQVLVLRILVPMIQHWTGANALVTEVSTVSPDGSSHAERQ
ncbi:MAG TPA: AI-2E family transporter, partial [Thermomicrobiaceae bacterium]|nr:AI-2E family transporter [Thermomicrobiaceae bacterium]